MSHKMKLVVKINAPTADQNETMKRLMPLLQQHINLGFTEGHLRDEATGTQARYSVTVDK